MTSPPDFNCLWHICLFTYFVLRAEAHKHAPDPFGPETDICVYPVDTASLHHNQPPAGVWPNRPVRGNQLLQTWMLVILSRQASQWTLSPESECRDSRYVALPFDLHPCRSVAHQTRASQCCACVTSSLFIPPLLSPLLAPPLCPHSISVRVGGCGDGGCAGGGNVWSLKMFYIRP